jgi:hypothetical protein
MTGYLNNHLVSVAYDVAAAILRNGDGVMKVTKDIFSFFII